MMKIQYTQKRLRSNFRLAIFYIIGGSLLFGTSVLSNSLNEIYVNSSGIGLIATGILFYFLYQFEKRKQYLTIENGVLTKQSLFPKQIKLNEVKQIKKFAGDYTLIGSDSSELVINTQIIDQESLKRLNEELKYLL